VSAAWQIRHDDLRGPAILALLQQPGALGPVTPPERAHALALDGLRQPGTSCWALWEGEALLGCGALKRLGSHDGELKSLRTAQDHQRRGVARALLAHLVAYARRQGMQRLWLQTGVGEPFGPARRLCQAAGFVACGPFGAYREDVHSAFMRLDLAPG
jgi:putative acetyltransferase